ncbi:MAG: nucleotidyltransferase domain-containing protein [Armatimonadota bacterium]|nr:nucleotidyltransferase domain-containing protein [Armatimonadota bacterium]
MPVRSLHSAVLKWPDRETIDRAVREWARELIRSHPEILAVGYIGSYARGDWGVGSDVDLLILVSRSALPFHRRSTEFDTSQLPVPADLFVYTLDEWQTIEREGRRFYRTVMNEVVWVYNSRVGEL